MRFLIDECAATELVAAAHARGHEAYHVAHVGKSGTPDYALARWAIEENLIIVTRNSRDFRGSKPPQRGGALGKEDLHPGLVCLNLPSADAETQAAAFTEALEYIEGLASMLNVVIEIHDLGDEWSIERYDMPPL
jgi:hypothetical protein